MVMGAGMQRVPCLLSHPRKFPARKILYYRDPTDPAYKSDKPGKSPKCGMDLEPVYEDSGEAHTQLPASSGSSSARKTTVDRGALRCRGIRFRLRDSAERASRKVELDENKVVRVATKLDGWVDTVDVNLVGTHVKYGQELLEIYNPQWQQQYRALVKAKEYSAHLAGMTPSSLKRNYSSS